MIVATENPVRPGTAKAAWNESTDDLKDLIKERGGPNKKVRVSVYRGRALLLLYL